MDALPKVSRSLDVRRIRTYTRIDQLREQESVEMVCSVFEISLSGYYEYSQRRHHIDVERMHLRSEVNRLFTLSRNLAGSRTLGEMLRELRYQVRRFKILRLMKDTQLISKHQASITINTQRLNGRIYQIIWTVNLMLMLRIKFGVVIWPMFGQANAGAILLLS